MEMTGFGIGGAAGILAGKGSILALTSIGLAATPLGWVVVIGVGIGAGFAAGHIMNKGGKGLTSWLWDKMK